MSSRRSLELLAGVLAWEVSESSRSTRSESDIHGYTGISTCGSDLHWNRCPSRSEKFRLIHCGVYIDSQLSQASTAVSASQDALYNIFERIENFFRRMETYIEVPPTAGMTDIIVKIMAEVLCILSIATKEMEQSRMSEFIPGGMTCPCRLTVV